MSNLIFNDYVALLSANIEPSIVLADYPAHFENYSADKPGMIHDRDRGANKYYPTMKLDDICDQKPPAASDAVMFFWFVPTHAEESFKIMRAWGFEPKTKAWTWLKLTKAGKPLMSQGYYTRQCTEDCWLATKGKPGRPATFGELALIEAAPLRLPNGRRVHSAKPDEQYAKIERLYPREKFEGERLEMYARRPAPGWNAFGNQLVVSS